MHIELYRTIQIAVRNTVGREAIEGLHFLASLPRAGAGREKTQPFNWIHSRLFNLILNSGPILGSYLYKCGGFTLPLHVTGVLILLFTCCICIIIPPGARRVKEDTKNKTLTVWEVAKVIKNMPNVLA